MDEQFAGDLEVLWVSDLPTSSLRSLVNGITPPGTWVLLSRVLDLLRLAEKQLMTLSSSVCAGRPVIVVNRDLDRLALAVLPSRQSSLFRETSSGLTERNAEDCDNKVNDLDIVGSKDIAASQSEAIKVAVHLLAQNGNDLPIGAEEYLEQLSLSPDPELTSGALKLAGSRAELHGVGTSYSPAEYRLFPRLLVSKELHRVRVSDYGDLEENQVKASFVRLHMEGQKSESHIGRLMRLRQRVPIVFSSSVDRVMFRLGVALQVDLEVLVSAAVSPFDRRLECLTLEKIVDREMAWASFKKVLLQMKLPMEL